MNYPGPMIPDRPADAPMPVDANPTIQDPAMAFARIRKRADYLAARDGGSFKKHRYTRKNFGNGRSQIHFQGIQRSRTGKYFFLSGAELKEHTSQLFVVRMNTRPADGPWGSNIRFDKKPRRGDRLLAMYKLNKGLYHAGGISLMGDVLMIPIEDREKSEVHFYDVSDPNAPKHFQEFISRGKTVGKATAVALCRLANDHYLCGVLAGDPRRIDFYMSRDTDFRNGFRPMRKTWLWTDLVPARSRDPRYQSINFLFSDSGELFMVGTESALLAPFENADRADLFSVVPDAATLGPAPSLKKPTITMLSTRRFHTGEDYHNLAAGGGIHIDRADSRLFVYGAFHWRISKQIRFGELAEDLAANAPGITQLSDGWVDLFDEVGFKGRRLSIYGAFDSEITNYGKIRVRDKSFGDRVSSVRFQLPVGETYRLFTREGFRSETNTAPFDLAGTGDVVQHADLDAWEDDEVESSKFV